MEQILKVEGLCRDYGRGTVTHAVDHVDFSVEKGEFVGIMGPSGSGKTTLLNCISTIDTPTAGHIWVEGKVITSLKQKQLSQFRRERLVQETAQLLEITDCLNKYPYQMSGGQQQRTAAARAIVTRPALILADEPTGALDSKSARLLLERFEVMNELCEATILMVTHDAFTASYCHRILFLRDGAVFAQLERGDLDRRDFFRRIIGVVTELGGDQNDVL